MIFGYREVGTVRRAVGVGGDVSRVVIDNGMGDVRVEAGASGVVEVSATFKAPPGEEHTVSERDVEITAGDGMLKIRAVEPPKTLSRRKVNWTLRIPPGMGLRVRCGVGNIDALGLSGEHDLRTGVGNLKVNADRATGASRLRAGTGKVSLEARSIEGEPGLLAGAGSIHFACNIALFTHASLKCATGNVTLKLPTTFTGHLDLKAAVGRVNLERDQSTVPVLTSFVGQAAKGALGDGPGEIEARTAVGSIIMTRG
jgi:hypothetical protein